MQAEPGSSKALKTNGDGAEGGRSPPFMDSLKAKWILGGNPSANPPPSHLWLYLVAKNKVVVGMESV